MSPESSEERSKRIIQLLKYRYPRKSAFDLDGRGLHFVCEIEPTSDHPEFDRAVEVIITSKPHKHLKMTQNYTILSGHLTLHYGKDMFNLKPGDKFIILPNVIHWATSNDECWLEIYSIPGWTKEDHIPINE